MDTTSNDKTFDKKHYIDLFRANGFNCFPIPYNQKAADSRYQASRTKPNQEIKPDENFGVLPTKTGKNCIIDIDDKERYRSFAEYLITQGVMVIESPHGWHIPIIGFSNNATKIELFDYDVQETKIVEIQGIDHYVVGCGSVVDGQRYYNKGTEKFANAKGEDFESFVDKFICPNLKVTGKKKKSRSSHHNYRQRFKEGKPPTKGTSNDYFYDAAIQCLSDGLTQDEAVKKIESVYNKWENPTRAFSNVEAKIKDAYENGEPLKEGRPKGEGDFDRTGIAQSLNEERKLYSNLDTKNLFENKEGFLEKISNSMQYELQQKFPNMESADYDSIMFKLRGLADPMPETNKDLIVFKGGIVFDKKKKTIVETEDIADMGFKDYNYLPPEKENEPVEFMKVMFDNVPDLEIPRVKAGLKSILNSYLDPKISVIYGASGVGKSTPLLILDLVLGEEYSLTVELNQFLEDKFIRAKIDGKRLLIFQDMPKSYQDFTTIKTITGEQRKTERGFMQDSVTFDNKLKIWASGNYLAKIPEEEQDAMYTRRLSLVHNIRTEPYKEDPFFAEKIAKEEGEKIISWLINLSDEECEYENKLTVKREWEGISSPEIEYLEKFYEHSDEEKDTSVYKLVKDFQEKYQQTMSMEQMKKSLKGLGYDIKGNIVKDLQLKPEQKDEGQSAL
jgi:ABC-type dipeptide/oligopeptide/nickel transport system ATPase subunit